MRKKVTVYCWTEVKENMSIPIRCLKYITGTPYVYYVQIRYGLKRIWQKQFFWLSNWLSNINLKIQHTTLNKQVNCPALHLEQLIYPWAYETKKVLPQTSYIALRTERRIRKDRLWTANPEEKVKQAGEIFCQPWSQKRHLIFPLPLVPFWKDLKLEAYAIPEIERIIFLFG